MILPHRQTLRKVFAKQVITRQGCLLTQNLNQHHDPTLARIEQARRFDLEATQTADALLVERVGAQLLAESP